MISEQAENYALAHSSALGWLEQEVLDYTLGHHAHAHMVSGAVQGQLLRQLSLLLRPQRILEIGTFTGFSALCLASGLAPEGELHTIELREDDARTAAGYFARSPRANQIHLHVGDAHTIIPSLAQPWDLVFLDADKTSYIDYYDMLLPVLPSGACILADNVLFHGQVLSAPISGKNARAVSDFNIHVAQDDRVEQVMLTVRDGLTLIRKK